MIPKRANITHSLGECIQSQHLLTYLYQVSSFNLPIQYDSSLITPVSLTPSQSIISTSTFSRKDSAIKLSPSAMSPTYPWLGSDDEYVDKNKSSEMKHKDPPGTRRISAADNSFPASPVVCYNPYFGQFGVSATTVSAPGTSPTMLPSPVMSTTNSLDNGDKPPRRNPSPQIHHSYIGPNQAPVLLSSPNPLTLRHSSKENKSDYRHNSINPESLQPVSPRSTTHPPLPETISALSSRRKRKPLREYPDGEVVLSGEMTTEEQILMRLAEQENLPWKEVALKFKEQTGKTMKIPALQMKKKRLVERLRVWTPSEVNAPPPHSSTTGGWAHIHDESSNPWIGTGSFHGLGRI